MLRRQVIDADFEPWLGGSRSRQSHSERKFLHAVIAVANRHGSIRDVADARGRTPFKGIRLGRGNAAAAALSILGRNQGLLGRRAVVTVRVARLRGNGMRAAQAHLRYIERDGVERNGERSLVYSAAEDRPNAREFLERCSGDRHYFRITASPEDGAQYEDLKPLIRRFMARMEDDLGTGLDWVAGNHADTLHPHTHLVLRGKDDHGDDLVIAPAYIRGGMYRRLAGIVSIDLGPCTEDEAALSLRREVEAECVTSLDHKLLSIADADGVIAVRGHNMVEQSLLTGRLHKLRALGLAEPLGGLRWAINENLEAVLSAVAERRDTARIFRRQLMIAALDRPIAQQVIHCTGSTVELVGRMVACGIAGDNGERRFVIVDAVDGRSHFVDLGTRAGSEPPPRGAIVRVASLHHHASEAGEIRVDVNLLSVLPLDELARHEGATWLDRELISPSFVARDAGFGHELRSAMATRRSWLVERGLATACGEQLTCRPDMLQVLERQELVRTATMLEAETGLAFAPIEEGRAIEGIVRRRVDLAGGRYAMIESSHEFALVPWQPIFERGLGAQVRATARVASMGWTLARGRELEI